MRKLTEEQKAKNHAEDLLRLKAFRPMDDTFMRGMFDDNLPLVELVLKIFTGLEDLVLLSCRTQADLKRVTGARSICLDAYGTDSLGRKYDLEVQRSDDGANPKRARYHGSVIDIENLDAGETFDTLPETYVIFITEKDCFGDGEALHVFINKDIKTGKPLGDGKHIIYVNGNYKGDDPIGRLIHDFNCSNPDKMHYKLMAERARYLKENQRGVEKMCKIMEDLRDQSYAEGVAEGIAKGIAEGIAKGKDAGRMETAFNMKNLGMSLDVIAKCVGVSEDTVRTWFATA